MANILVSDRGFNVATDLVQKYLVPAMNVLEDPLMPSREQSCSSLEAGAQPELTCSGSRNMSPTSGVRATSSAVPVGRTPPRSTLAPTSAGFGSSTPALNSYLTPLANHNSRLFASCALLLVFFGVFIGRRFVARVSSVALVSLLLALLAVFIGLFVPLAHSEDSKYACFSWISTKFMNRHRIFRWFFGLCGHI